MCGSPKILMEPQIQALQKSLLESLRMDQQFDFLTKMIR